MDTASRTDGRVDLRQLTGIDMIAFFKRPSGAPNGNSQQAQAPDKADTRFAIELAGEVIPIADILFLEQGQRLVLLLANGQHLILRGIQDGKTILNILTSLSDEDG